VRLGPSLAAAVLNGLFEHPAGSADIVRDRSLFRFSRVLERFFNSLLDHIIHDGSSRNRAVASRDGHAEPLDPEAYFNSTSRGEAASLPAAGLSQQRMRDCSRSGHE
jgi:hypothetical protein